MSPAEQLRAEIEMAKVEFEKATGSTITRIEVTTETGYVIGTGDVSWIRDVKVETVL